MKPCFTITLASLCKFQFQIKATSITVAMCEKGTLRVSFHLYHVMFWIPSLCNIKIVI